MRIVAMDADERPDSSKAPITWIGEQLLATSHQMNLALVTNDDGTYQEGTGAIGGWEHSEMRKYLKETIKPLIPEEVRKRIVEVKKYTRSLDISGEVATDYETIDDVWIPSSREIFGGTSYETQGVIYNKYNSVETRKKMKANGSSYDNWWFRSANKVNTFANANVSGTISSSSSIALLDIALGFCT